MAIRQVGNTIIIDSVGLIGVQPATQRSGYKVLAIGLYSLNTAGVINIAMAADTTNIIFPLVNNTAHTPNFEVFNIDGLFSDELRVITVTAATGYLYLG